ncbi:hypothetical protein D8X55_01695 [Malacoplasma penetrans]|uniref:Low similarity to ATP synthase subunit gamma n=1 Tax=Malacoplasma penetrans (strain HF-2) TaxID=272633 RepID=Q8EWP4_MALP2|nr:hypothetical protein [Malacoplasma penetrans]RXY96987.1 hypothetical protein D8X55_01695 [Malacoplasma penetrans]BAC43950.1 low similarity to ATP synthase subunit gamma [Malacoplasma penetrans HF-2]
MIKLSSNKYGCVNLDSKYLHSIIERLALDVVEKKDLVKIDFDTKKNSLKKVELFFNKNTNISLVEQKNLYDQILFTLSMQFGISNSLVIFSYES